MHPVVRSILLHFWLGFDHPFVDGNGRTARALFYWSMAKQGYWLTEFLSISRLLKKGPSRYARAYLHAEIDNDATYFVLHQLQTIRQAIDELTAYLKRKTREIRETEHVVKRADDLNHRQITLIGHALRHLDAEYTIEGHRASHDIVYETARKDLLDLAARGWFTQRKQGRTFVYVPAPDLDRRVAGKKR
jgi:Fic family protein